MATVNGRVRKFEDNIDTDTITPGNILHLPMEELKQHVFSPVSADYYKTIQPGDIIVAGHNFGCGSSREQATAVVKELGIAYIVCESMARIYFRNCIALGVYPIMSPGASGIFSEGDPISIDLDGGKVVNPKTKESTQFEPLSGTPKEILDSGGILPLIKKIAKASA
ncbi:MAG: 3-isopropylmalate dehydratase [Deltaproteobacteria bacterium]|jgi:3-isopropylmalate dehydratase small subunit|nr:3-isopropylmalate dehydratase [Deltaproteobacteria bacterium]